MYKGIRLTDYAINVLRSSKTHREVAVELETHPYDVYKERKRLGVKFDSQMPRNVQRKNRQLVMSITVIQMLNSCMTTATIARTLCFSENCIRRHRQKLKAISVEWPKMTDEKIEQLRQSTLKSRDIASILGVSKRTINLYRSKFKNEMASA